MRTIALATAVVTAAGLCLIDPCVPATGGTAHAQASRLAKTADPCCDLADVPGVVWFGMDSTMTVERLAAYCAPILWFSPDEPLLDGRQMEVLEKTTLLAMAKTGVHAHMSAAMRRQKLRRGLFRWKMTCGDASWLLDLLKRLLNPRRRPG